MPNRIVDIVDALNAGVASGEDFYVTVMDDGGGTERLRATIGRACRHFATVETGLLSLSAVSRLIGVHSTEGSR
ncbi:MAG: hypothetical protein JWO52_4691 [Gammaproteobacteria bacterium]|nr:hypothetical protein [Gammaproteobacteria bacterium]